MNERATFGTLDAALAKFDYWPAANRPEIREKIASLDVREIYVPPGRGYIGIALTGGGPIVSVHSGYIWNLRREDGSLFGHALPVNSLRDGNGQKRTDLPTQLCPECGLVLPLSGLCDCW